MNKDKLQQDIDAMKARLADMEAGLEKAEKLELWKPERDQIYYFIWNTGDILTSRWDGGDIDNNRYNTGACFQTKEDAEYYAKRWAARQRLERLAELANGEKYEFVSGNRNYYIDCGYRHIRPLVGIAAYCPQSIVYFKSREAAQLALDSLSDEDTRILFGGK